MNSILNPPAKIYSLLFFLITFAAYSPSLHGDFIWDDDLHVIHIEKLKSIEGLKQIWFKQGSTLEYYPLLFSTFWIERHLFGDNPVGYHAVNILLHVCNALFFKRILTQLSVPGAVWAAAIFALHPVHVESVAWITERKNCLSTFFYFLSLFFYLRFAGIETENSHGLIKNKSLNYIFAFIFFIAALLSKTVTCTLPAAILLFIWWKTKTLKWKQIGPTLPFFMTGIFLAVITYRVETRFVGASGPDWDFHWIDRFLIAGKALWFYISKILWPQPLIFTYPRWNLDSTNIIQLFFPISFLLFIFFLWLNRKKWGDGILIGILFFAGTLTPALGFFDFYWMRFSFVADHLQYPASTGIIAIAASLITWYANKRRATIKIALPIILIILGSLTYEQNHIYRNNEHLWKDTITKNPSSWMAHNNLGSHLAEKGEIREAIIHYRAAINIKPDHALAHSNLGTILYVKGELDQAITHFSKALKVAPNNPLTHNNLGEALRNKGQFDNAITHYKAAIKIKPEFALAHNNLGSVLTIKGEVEKAIFHYKRALEINPRLSLAQSNLDNLLQNMPSKN